MFLLLFAAFLLAGCPARRTAEAAPQRLPERPATALADLTVRAVELPVTPGFPVWLEAEGVRTDQTSGIAFVDRTTEGGLLFFLCDDVGAFHRLTLWPQRRPEAGTTGEGWMRIEPVTIPLALRAEFGTGPAKLDLEEVAVLPPPVAGGAETILVTVEGQRLAAEERSDPGAHWPRNRVVSLTLDAPLASATTVTAIQQLPVVDLSGVWATDWPSPWAGWQPRSPLPVAGLAPNRGFEGMAARWSDAAGSVLELWIAPEERYPADPVIPVAWQGALPLFTARVQGAAEPHAWRTQQLPAACGVMSVCGLALERDGSAVYVLDRNLSRIHRCALDADATIVAVETAQLTLRGPSGEPYFTPSLESLTLDDAGGLWSVVDPWKYRPLTPADQPLPEAEQRRYRHLVPLLYSFGAWPTSPGPHKTPD